MLTIILTRNKLLAGVHGEKNELLSFGTRKYLDYAGKPMLQALEAGLDKVANAYAQFKRIDGKSVEERIPTAVAFAVGNQKRDGSLYDVDEVSDFFKKKQNIKFELFHVEHLPISYIRGVNGSTALAKESVIVLEALDDHLNLCYCNIPTSAKLNGKPQGKDALRYISYKEIGHTAAVSGVYNEVLKEFTQAGLALDAKTKDQLQTQVTSSLGKGFSDQTFKINRAAGKVSIKAEFGMTARRQEEVSASNVTSLKEILSKEQIDSLGIKKVVLLGDYLDNRVFRDYLNKDLKLGAKLLAPNRTGWDGDYLSIVKGLGHSAVEAKNRSEESARIRKEEEDRHKALAREQRLKAERDKLLEDIRRQCIDATKKNEYEAKYVTIGAKLNMPKEVIAWNIQEALSSASLQKTPSYPNFGGNSLAVSSNLPATSRSMNGSKLKSLEEIFDIKGVLVDPEFATKKAGLKGSAANKVVRLLDANSMGNPDKVARFERLYQKELIYYQELSEIKDALEGKYYYRDFIPRNTLKDHVKKSGIDKKESFSKLSSKDIKFILRVFDEVKGLSVPHANLSDSNILVIQEGLLKRNTEIKFVGFSSEDCSSSEMLEKLHKAFSGLVKPKVYAEFRKNLNI